MNNIIRHLTNSEGFVEQRKTARLDVAVKVQYRVIGSENREKRTKNRAQRTECGGQSTENGKIAVTKNISAGGCLLLVAEELKMNSEVELQVYLGETDSEALTVKGRLARLNRQEKNLYEYGIAFDAISKETRRLFADYFFTKMYEMIGLSEWPTDKRTK